MPQQLALLICLVFIICLFVRDQKLRPMTSLGLWVTLPWIMLIGSKFISSWVGTRGELESIDEVLDGSPLDRNVFILLIVMGAVVLYRRRSEWYKIFDSNRWFFAFFIYCGISILWSDYPFVSCKRWVKELGNVIMVMIIITETDPVQATRAVLARYTYFAIPLSIVLIKFFPEIGTYDDREIWETLYRGVSKDKNWLGITTFICGLFLVWDLIHMRNEDGKRRDILDLFVRGLLLLMVTWLMYISHSSTALVCMLLGVAILLLMKFQLIKGQVKYVGTYSLVVGFLVFLFYSVPGVLAAFAKAVGREATFTGRTDLWKDLLAEPINLLLGTGYQGFWLGPRADFLWEKYSFHPAQAHNGYLEVYLNGGLVGVFLLIAVILVTGSRLKKALLSGSSFGILLFAFLVTALFYNWTEARFSSLNLLWVLLSLAALYNPSLYVRQKVA